MYSPLEQGMNTPLRTGLAEISFLSTRGDTATYLYSMDRSNRSCCGRGPYKREVGPYQDRGGVLVFEFAPELELLNSKVKFLMLSSYPLAYSSF